MLKQRPAPLQRYYSTWKYSAENSTSALGKVLAAESLQAILGTRPFALCFPFLGHSFHIQVLQNTTWENSFLQVAYQQSFKSWIVFYLWSLHSAANLLLKLCHSDRFITLILLKCEKILSDGLYLWQKKWSRQQINKPKCNEILHLIYHFNQKIENQLAKLT